jgi:hypothetical protein
MLEEKGKSVDEGDFEKKVGEGRLMTEQGKNRLFYQKLFFGGKNQSLFVEIVTGWPKINKFRFIAFPMSSSI